MADLDSTRCSQEIPQSSNSAACDAVLCNAPATIQTESGPRCASCFAEFGEVVAVVTDKRPISVLWRIANTQAAAELSTRFAEIGNGLFVRVGRGKGGR